MELDGSDLFFLRWVNAETLSLFWGTFQQDMEYAWNWMQRDDTVDGRNPKQPPGMYGNPVNNGMFINNSKGVVALFSVVVVWKSGGNTSQGLVSLSIFMHNSS